MGWGCWVERKTFPGSRDFAIVKKMCAIATRRRDRRRETREARESKLGILNLEELDTLYHEIIEEMRRRYEELLLNRVIQESRSIMQLINQIIYSILPCIEEHYGSDREVQSGVDYFYSNVFEFIGVLVALERGFFTLETAAYFLGEINNRLSSIFYQFNKMCQ